VSRAIRGLYAVTPDGLEDRDLLAEVEEALLGGASLVQYRNKDAASQVRRRQAQALLALCRHRGVPLIINDDAALAAAVGADGVHIGREDGSTAEARAQVGARAIIGVSCYNELERARIAQQSGADYVAFGSFFPSGIKPAAARASLRLLREAKREVALPIVAIGGITPDNAARVVAAGADSIAVISALFHAPDVRAAALELSRLFSECEYR